MHNKMKKFSLYTLICFLTFSCTTVLEGSYTWDEFIQERSANGDFFFAEATSPDGSVSFGSSNDSQWEPILWQQGTVQKTLVKFVE